MPEQPGRRLPRPLDATEARVLGSLLEKQQTTPEAYPLTLHALRAACNQTTNREPVTSLSEEQIGAALERLRELVLVWKSDGPRAEKWEENIASKLGLARPAKALLTLLFLRGAQTPGEMRGRSERMNTFPGIADVERTLAELAQGPEPLVSELPRRPGQKETRWRELLTSQDAELLAVAPPETPRPDRLARIEERLAALEAEVTALRARHAL